MTGLTNIESTIDHLFRREYGKLLSVLTRIFGPQNLVLAEDVVQETLVVALDNWKFNGLPENPSAWLFTVAKRKAIDLIRKQKRQYEFAQDISYLLKSEYSLIPKLDELMNDGRIEDDQLRMMFTCCHPSLSPELQVALILKTLCGFSITEIAKAFLTGNDAIEKRLYRAKQYFRENKNAFDLDPGAALDIRLDSVLTAIYLMFNESYNSTQDEQLIRDDMMNESARLCHLLIANPSTRHPRVYALAALINFIAARNKARLDSEGNILLFKMQDRNLWNRDLIKEGFHLMNLAAWGNALSNYHIEAAIAAEYVVGSDYASTDWRRILIYYDLLYKLRPSPVVALNRAIAISESEGASAGISAICEIANIESLTGYYLLPATLGELYAQLQEFEKAKLYFQEAFRLTRSATERKLLKAKLALLPGDMSVTGDNTIKNAASST